jgi:hypothetical protein
MDLDEEFATSTPKGREMLLIAASLALTFVLSVGLGWLIGRDTLPLPRPAVLARVCLPLGLVGVALIAVNGRAIDAAMARRQWPTVPGLVVGARTVALGRKNYQPEITYTYTVDGQLHQRVTHLDTPGFGFSSSREQVAATIVHQYPLGLEVTVWINPADPTHSTLRPGPGWEYFTRYAFGIVLLALAVLLQTARTWGRLASAPAAPAG